MPSTLPTPEVWYNGLFETLNVTQRHDVYPGIDVHGALKGASSGKIVVVTGASKGIGEATAKAFAQAGAEGILLTSRTLPDLLRAKADIIAASTNEKLKVEVFAADVSVPEQVKSMIDHCLATFGRIDIIISNAGYMTTWNRISEHAPDAWWKTWETNIRGTFNVAHYGLPALIKTAGYFVILTSFGAQVRYPGGSAYLGGKHALNRLAEFVHIEYKESGVKSFAFSPGIMLTELAHTTPEIEELIKVGILWEDTLQLPAYSLVRLTSGSEDYLCGRYISANWDLDEVAALKDKIVSEELLINKLALPAQ